MLEKQEKTQLRKKLLAKLADLAKNEIIRRSEDAETKISSLSIYKNSKVIMFYYPLRRELDLRKIIRKSLLTKRVCLPVTDVLNKQLRVYQIIDLDSDLVEGAFGTKEPNKEKVKEVDFREIDTIIVPGLAFDYQKNRLGRGGGFYDRFLRKIPNSTKKIGVAFDFQLLENLPVNLSQDQKVDLVVTDSKVIQ